MALQTKYKGKLKAMAIGPLLSEPWEWVDNLQEQAEALIVKDKRVGSILTHDEKIQNMAVEHGLTFD